MVPLGGDLCRVLSSRISADHEHFENKSLSTSESLERPHGTIWEKKKKKVEAQSHFQLHKRKNRFGTTGNKVHMGFEQNEFHRYENQ
ncbi:hypothetical protein CDAR_409611 [Caerostris darwini]|uniref:Uncharacterized protein n=1 Tax=Caerostris darwini TaxID=1538125 RepID=A0AAV4S5C5_9ARAC|nr:hypothetical protein CDAR_409611 [Caerostris darwini]